MSHQPAALLDDYRWLVGDEAGHILRELAETPADALRAAKKLRKSLSLSRTCLVLEQLELRRRARSRFHEADRMFFTPLGLEQATDTWVAQYKSQRFGEGEGVLDLCCGIGGDLLALACRGPCTGFERQRVTAFFAKVNSGPRADVIAMNITAANVAELAHSRLAWHIDPDRRPRGQRTTRAELHEPRPDVIDCLVDANGSGAVKFAPAADLPERWTRRAELEWISRAGEGRQLVAWFGRLAKMPAARRATVIFGSGPTDFRTLTGDPRALPPAADCFGRYLAEPDAAVLAAGLVGALALEHNLAAIAPGAVYLTGDRANIDPALTWFEITDALPFDLRRLKALLRERGLGELEIKKRGIEVDPEHLRHQLRVPGDERATLFLARRGRAVTALLARRLSSS